VIGLVLLGLLVLVLVVTLAIAFWVAVSQRWQVRAERSRMDLEVRRAERQLHDLASQAFASMIDNFRGGSSEASRQ
jgi:hypothetical protein